MNLTNTQINVLIALSKPYRDYEMHHPKDAYKTATIEALKRNELVEEYSYRKFLHGAMRLTKKGRDIVEEN